MISFAAPQTAFIVGEAAIAGMQMEGCVCVLRRHTQYQAVLA